MLAARLFRQNLWNMASDDIVSRWWWQPGQTPHGQLVAPVESGGEATEP
jgi:hypothetical protein